MTAFTLSLPITELPITWEKGLPRNEWLGPLLYPLYDHPPLQYLPVCFTLVGPTKGWERTPCVSMACAPRGSSQMKNLVRKSVNYQWIRYLRMPKHPPTKNCSCNQGPIAVPHPKRYPWIFYLHHSFLSRLEKRVAIWRTGFVCATLGFSPVRPPHTSSCTKGLLYRVWSPTLSRVLPWKVRTLKKNEFI